jgi:rhodanese-related sulfurtransferase
MHNNDVSLCGFRPGLLPTDRKGRALLMARLAFLCLWVFPGLCPAQDAENSEQDRPNVSAKSSTGFCGLYSLYTVLRLAGSDVEFSQLVKPELVDSERGSSLAQLKVAAEEYGLYASPMGNLTTQVLRNSPHPIILHVKKSWSAPQYDHYELYLGALEGKAVLCDAPDNIRLEEFHDLAPRWDGRGLVLSTQPIQTIKMALPAWKRIFVLGGFTLVVLGTLNWLRRRLMPFGQRDRRSRRAVTSLAEGVILVVLALVASASFHWGTDSGFLANSRAVLAIQDDQFAAFLPKVSPRRVRRLLTTDTVFVDARSPRDFEAGHIEDAINVPPNADEHERAEALGGPSNETNIVVYCQSVSCPFAAKVAKTLADDGFKRIALFKGGWEEWQLHNPE